MSFSGPQTDQIAIRALVDSYADAVFRRDGDAWIACWSGHPKWDLAGTVIEGRETVLGAWQQAMSDLGFVAFFSQVGSIMVSEETATMRLYTHEFLELENGTKQRVLGQYDDYLVKQGGEWRFAHRKFQIKKEWPT